MACNATGALIHGAHVPMTTSLPEGAIARALTSSLFQDWVNSLEPSFVVTSIEVQSIDMFGPRVGFLKILVAATLEGKAVPGVIFLRGGSVAILPLITCQGERWVLCTRQPRIASGASRFLEIPAGMLDGSGRFASVAANEMREETGIEMHASELVDLTALAYGSSPFSSTRACPGVFPSVGACDEFIRLFLFEAKCSPEYLEQLQGLLAGNADEDITVKLIRYGDMWRETPDVKALSAMILYERLSAAGCLPRSDRFFAALPPLELAL